MTSRDSGPARHVFTAILLLIVALATVARLRNQLGVAAFALTLAGAALLAGLCTWRARRGRAIHGFLSIGIVLLLLGVPELALRAAGFRHETGIEFGYPRPTNFLVMKTDPRLFWRMDPANPQINSLGFPGPEIGPKREGVLRVVFLGDSCTYQGKGNGAPLSSGYVGTAEATLNAGRPEPRVEFIRLSVPGYTSHQGRVLAELYGAQLEPDVAVVYFGWNDTWQAYGSTDREKVIPSVSSSGAMKQVYRGSRTLQFLTKLRSTPPTLLAERRVPLDHYEENLTEIARTFHAAGVPVVFITAPTSHHKLGIPDYLTEMNFVPSKDMASQLHRDYTDVVRRVAEQEDCLLLDLEEEFDTLAPERMRAVFLEDGIHFTAEGIDAMAEAVAAFVEQRFLSDPG